MNNKSQAKNDLNNTDFLQHGKMIKPDQKILNVLLFWFTYLYANKKNNDESEK